MYKKDDLIIYGGEGVCRVSAVGAPPLSGIDPNRCYYTLEPIYHGGVVYAPADGPIPTRPVLSEEEAWALIRKIPEMPADFAHNPDPKQAAASYKGYLQTYDCENLLLLIRMIYAKNKTAILAGKNYGQIDDRFLKRAKALLYGELAVSLDIPVERVEETITKTLDEIERGA